MTGSLALRVIFILAAVLSPFLFPYPYTIFLSFIASMFVPYVALLVGILTDALYLVPHTTTLPLGAVVGAGVSLVAFVVRRFIKARIM